MKTLLHICCGPCGTASLERLRERAHVTLFFSNSNIWPEHEYEKRLCEVRRLALSCGCALAEDVYDHASWLDFVKGLETEPERGERCLRCFEFSLTRAALYAEAHGFDSLTTTLTISPHKRSRDIFRVGHGVSERFLEVDFKKKDGFRRSLELSKNLRMYRQDYCGCEFSIRHADTLPRARDASA